MTTQPDTAKRDMTPLSFVCNLTPKCTAFITLSIPDTLHLHRQDKNMKSKIYGRLCLRIAIGTAHSSSVLKHPIRRFQLDSCSCRRQGTANFTLELFITRYVCRNLDERENVVP